MAKYVSKVKDTEMGEVMLDYPGELHNQESLKVKNLSLRNA